MEREQVVMRRYLGRHILFEHKIFSHSSLPSQKNRMSVHIQVELKILNKKHRKWISSEDFPLRSQITCDCSAISYLAMEREQLLVNKSNFSILKNLTELTSQLNSILHIVKIIPYFTCL